MAEPDDLVAMIIAGRGLIHPYLTRARRIKVTSLSSPRRWQLPHSELRVCSLPLN